jgi:hypothetical protein
MADPFAILANSQVDVPSLLNAYTEQKQRGIENQYRQQALARQQKMDQRADTEYEGNQRARGLIASGAKPEEVIAADPTLGFDYAKHSGTLAKEARAKAAERADAVGTAALMVQRLPQAQQAQAWDQAIDGLVGRGYDDLAAYKGHYDPAKLPVLIAESEKAVGHYLTTEQQDRQFGETARHNRAGEGIAGANLDLSRQREARVTKWGPQKLVVAGVMPQGNGDDLDAKYGGQ